MGTIVFHAKRHRDDVNPNHTIAFQKQEDGTLHCTYAKPHNGMDSYSKKFGRELAERRMDDFNEKIGAKKIKSKQEGLTTARKIKRFVPNTVVSSMAYYADKARKALKIDDDNPIIVRGQFADWERYESEELKMVPTCAVALTVDLNVIRPKDED